MKEVKQFSKSYVFISALYVVLGSVLLAWPSSSLRVIYYTLAFAMVVLGISYGVMYFTRDNQRGFLQMDLVIGIVCLAFGVYLLFNPTFLDSALPFAMGILLLLGAVVKIQSAVNMKRLRFSKWYLVLLCALIISVLGVVLLCNPFQSDRQRILFIGSCLVLDGLTNLTTLICIRIRVKKLNRLQKNNPKADLNTLLDMQQGKPVDKTVQNQTSAGNAPDSADVVVYSDDENEKEQE